MQKLVFRESRQVQQCVQTNAMNNTGFKDKMIATFHMELT